MVRTRPQTPSRGFCVFHRLPDPAWYNETCMKYLSLFSGIGGFVIILV